eukprot:492404-Amorphochlora_amoeboformis.AAC.1
MITPESVTPRKGLELGYESSKLLSGGLPVDVDPASPAVVFSNISYCYLIYSIPALRLGKVWVKGGRGCITHM